jgi:hypothetical protein
MPFLKIRPKGRWSSGREENMSRSAYIKLMEGFCKLVGMQDAQTFILDAAVTVQGVTFSLIHDEQADPGLVCVYTDLGKLPPKRELETCMELMEANLSLYPCKLPVFGISPITRNVTLAAPYAVSEMTPEILRDLLLGLVKQAKEWRNMDFRELKPKMDSRRGGFNWNALVQAQK